MKTETELRELDAWIAERVFGYRIERGHMEYDGSQIPWEVWVDSLGNKYNPKKFTTDPAAAMLVLEKCAEETGHGVFIFRYAGDAEWVITDDFYSVRAEGETLPLAICLFAKKLFSK